jgi:two-component system, NarL family, nitrate/nitrite response regulator NarL
MAETGRSSSKRNAPRRAPTTSAVPIRLVLASKDAILIAGLDRLFGLEKDFQVVASHVWGKDILQTVASLWPDILLFDPPSAAGDGLALLGELKKLEVTTRTVILTGTLEETDVMAAIRLGVRGIVGKDSEPRLIVQCIREVHAGRIWLGRGVATPARGRSPRVPAAAAESTLTPRELEIVRHVCAGLTNRQIAERLRIGEGTVKTHLHQIYDKLHLRGRLQLGLHGRDKGLS